MQPQDVACSLQVTLIKRPQSWLCHFWQIWVLRPLRWRVSHSENHRMPRGTGWGISSLHILSAAQRRYSRPGRAHKITGKFITQCGLGTAALVLELVRNAGSWQPISPISKIALKSSLGTMVCPNFLRQSLIFNGVICRLQDLQDIERRKIFT